MPEKSGRSMSPYKGGMFQDLALRIKLILRLMADSRVSPLLKLIPLGSLIYLLFPDIAPGPIDDAAIIWVGSYLFVELCPPEVVEELMASLTNVIPGEFREVSPDEAPGEVIEGNFHDGENGEQ